MARERDTGRSKVYEAQQAVYDISMRRSVHTFYGSTLQLEPVVPLPTLQSAQWYVDLAWTTHTGDLRKIPEVRFASARSAVNKAFYATGLNYIQIPDNEWGRSKWTLLHEVAHALTSGRHQTHGTEWKKNYVSLVRQHISPEWSLVLADAFDLAGSGTM